MHLFNGAALCQEHFRLWLALGRVAFCRQLFLAIFMDSMICNLRAAGFGANIGKFYFGCLLYADDISLVCHSITAMQLMLDICSKEADMLDFSFNTVKSVALSIGPRYRRLCFTNF